MTEAKKDLKEKTSSDGQDVDQSKRNFLKLGIAGAGIAATAAAGGTFISHKLEGTPMDDIVASDQFAKDFKPLDQRQVILTFATSRALAAKHPERTEVYNRTRRKENPNHKDLNFQQGFLGFGKQPPRRDTGYTQLEKALEHAGWAPENFLAFGEAAGRPRAGALGWSQEHVAKNQYKFSSRQEATQAIKSAARLFGAYSCGIARHDPRFDYDPIYDSFEDKTLSWEKDFPFKPKSVIVMLWEMDYHAIATAPAYPASAAAAEGYSQQVKGAVQLKTFLQGLGYQAVGAGNDLGISTAYAILAGLAEGARNGSVIAPKIGCRLRISKVYTDFDFVEYGQPRDFGVNSFCQQCKRCATACPSQAISHDDKPSLYPTYSDDPDYTWNNHQGIYKFHNDAKKCFNFWITNDGDCCNCIAACPYNKPDYWHHRFVDAQNVIAPSWIHRIMREFDIIFGYGKVAAPEKVKYFWRTGRKI